MTFSKGDKIRYKTGKDKVGPWSGWEGTVESEFGGVTDCVTTKAKDYADIGSRMRLTTENLELITPTFTYDDIQVGDKIRRTLTRETGTTEVREGTVVSKNGGLAVDRDGPLSYILAYSSDGHPDKPLVVLELLDRPKPKHWTETKPVGSVAVILDGTFTKTLKKTSEFGWNVLYAVGGYTYKDTNKAIERRVTGLDEDKIHWVK